MVVVGGALDAQACDRYEDGKVCLTQDCVDLSIDTFATRALADMNGSPVALSTGRRTTLSLLWMVPAACVVAAVAAVVPPQVLKLKTRLATTRVFIAVLAIAVPLLFAIAGLALPYVEAICMWCACASVWP